MISENPNPEQINNKFIKFIIDSMSTIWFLITGAIARLRHS